ncbi:MAG: GspE/PulE family protein [Treponema sp.]|jgi:general secretion pathway protein E/type IV pilus assembly protein PilB|nr:GspE/PulE family protein [Treponema sp.]
MERISLKDFQFDSAFGEQYSREFIGRRGAIKIRETPNEVHIAITDGKDDKLRHDLENYHNHKKIVFFGISKAELATFIGETTAIAPVVTGAAQEKDRFIALDAITEGAPVVNIINAICIEAIRLESSDIHIEAHADSVHIRYRIDGVLRTIKKIDKSVSLTISNRIKIMANLNPLEQRLPQDGRMSVTVENSTIDLRVSIIPVANGESIVLRIFNTSAKLLSLDELGFYPQDLNYIKSTVQQPFGLILLTGPTGSGKTTTLHALIASLPVSELKIITIEDPVEQLIRGVNQVQINDEINLSFDGMLRRVLRQDPNVIMVGEIRDTATAELAVRSALTGHLILSTLHTNDSISVITRLENMGLEPYLIAAVLRCSVAQRLVRKICPSCRKKVSATKKVKSLLEKHGVSGNTVYESSGCSDCEHTGYKGRTVISEVFMVDKNIEELIAERRPVKEIVKYSLNAGMSSITKNALQKVADGITSLREVEREVLF